MPAKGQDIMPNARSIYLARLMGPVLIAMSIGVLVNMTVFRTVADEVLHSHALIFITGLLTLVAGVAIVLAHNVWKNDWPLIITVLGWLAIIGGAVRVVAPQLADYLATGFSGHPAAAIIPGFVFLVCGAVLGYFGYPELWASAQAPRRTSRKRRR